MERDREWERGMAGETVSEREREKKEREREDS